MIAILLNALVSINKYSCKQAYYLDIFVAPLAVTSYPTTLFSQGIKRIAVGSVVWLYCQVNSISPSLRVTWLHQNNPIDQNVPHIRIRRLVTTYYTIGVLVIDNFGEFDGGTYSCDAQNGNERVMGDSVDFFGKV